MLHYEIHNRTLLFFLVFYLRVAGCVLSVTMWHFNDYDMGRKGAWGKTSQGIQLVFIKVWLQLKLNTHETHVYRGPLFVVRVFHAFFSEIRSHMSLKVITSLSVQYLCSWWDPLFWQWDCGCVLTQKLCLCSMVTRPQTLSSLVSLHSVCVQQYTHYSFIENSLEVLLLLLQEIIFCFTAS